MAEEKEAQKEAKGDNMTQVPDPPWKQATAAQRSRRQEDRIARESGGRRQVNSGRVWFSPRDVRGHGFLIEARTTRANSYTVTRPEFESILKQALGTPPGQLPAMQIDFEGTKTLSLFLMRHDDHLYFMERIGLLEDEVRRLKEELKNSRNL